jgi:hypothetical protein
MLALQFGGEAVHGGGSLMRCDAALEMRTGGEPSHVPVREAVAVEGRGGPDIGGPGRHHAVESGGRDSSDDERLAVDPEDLSGDGGVGMEATAPELVRDDGEGLVLVRCVEQAAGGGHDGKRAEIIAEDSFAEHLLAFDAAADGEELAGCVGERAIEDLVEAMPVLKLRVGKGSAGSGSDADHAGRDGLKEEGVDEAEDHGIGADADGETRRGGGGEGGVLAQIAGGVAEILAESREPGEGGVFAAGFLGAVDAAEAVEDFAAGIVRRGAGGDLLADAHVEMESEFLVEILLELLGAEGGGEALDPRHRSPLCEAQDLGDTTSEFAPALLFGLQLLSAGSGKAIKFGGAAVFGVLPLGANPAGLLDAVQGGIKRAFFHAQKLLADLLDAGRDAVAMHRAGVEGLQD